MTSLERKRSSYDASFKLHVIEFAENSSNSAAERQYGVSEKLVRDWRKQKHVLTNMPRAKKARRGATQAAFPLLEKALHEWVSDHRRNGHVVTRTAIRLHALKMAKQAPFATEVPANFRASAGWCTRFMNRNDLTIRQRTKIAQKLPRDLEAKVDSFLQYVIKLRKQHNYELGQIGNMDETPMTFDIPSNKTVNTVGEKSVMIKTTGHERTHFTAVLSCLADGTKLRPVVIFKRKTLPKTAKFPSGIIVKAHPKGWMDTDGTRDWLKKVWRPGALLGKRVMLVWDMFRAHITDEVKGEVARMKTDMCVIPGGLTSVLQPLDVCINKPFKDSMRQLWTDWMASDEVKTTKGGNLMKPDIEVVCAWVKNAWDDIPADMVKQAFLKCGISNSMDGSQDDAVYEDDQTEGN